ncbi:MAG: hypothetical protein ACREBG_27440 [Pyrinomonadaceae bacterium]
MAFIDIPGWPIAFPGGVEVGSSFAGFSPLLIDATAEKVAFVFQCPKTGTLDVVGFLLGSVTQAPANGLTVSFQDVDPATGRPDGVKDQFRLVSSGIASSAWITTGLLTSDGTDSGTKRTVTKGEILAVVIEFASFLAGDSMSINAGDSSVFDIGAGQFPFSALFTASWATSGRTLNLALQYSTGIWERIIGATPASGVANPAFTSATNPNEVGMEFICPVAVRAVGFTGMFRPNGTTSTYRLTLYDSANTALATTIIDPDIIRIAGGVGLARFQFNGGVTEVEMETGGVYKVALLATGAGNVNVYGFTVNDAAHKSATPWGASASAIQRQGSGAFTKVSTTYYALGLLIDAIDPIKGGESVGVDSWSPVLFGEEWY